MVRISLKDWEYSLMKIGLLRLEQDEKYLKEIILAYLKEKTEYNGMGIGSQKKKTINEMYDILQPIYLRSWIKKREKEFSKEELLRRAYLSNFIDSIVEDLKTLVHELFERELSQSKIPKRLGRHRNIELKGWRIRKRKGFIKEILKEYEKVLGNIQEQT